MRNEATRFFSKRIGRLLTWLAALVVASLVIPAITTQWSDRQKELDTKTVLIAQLTESAAATIQDATNFVDVQSKARVVDTDGWLARYRAILKDWRVPAFTLESRFSAYFPDARVRERGDLHLTDAFRTYNNQVQQFIMITRDYCKYEYKDGTVTYKPRADLAELLAHVPTTASTKRRCWDKSEEFRKAYQALGEKILERRNAFAKTIVRSSAAGYNVGFRDFLRQVLPFYG